MSTLGIVGGIGPESTVDYYRSLINMWLAGLRTEYFPVRGIHRNVVVLIFQEHSATHNLCPGSIRPP